MIELFCNKCFSITTHVVFLEKTERDFITDRFKMLILEMWTDNTVKILKCQGCGELIIRKSKYWSEDRKNITGELIEKDIEIFPLRHNSNLRPPKSLKFLSKELSNFYEEIFNAYTNRSLILCTIGIRAIIEKFCDIVGIKKGDKLNDGTTIQFIYHKVLALFQRGYITENHLNYLQFYREMGNEATHELKIPTNEEIENALNIIAHTIDTIFLTNQSKEKFK